MLLSEARLRVYNILDDDGTGTVSGTRWSLSEVDTALMVSVDMVASSYARMGGSKLDELVSINLSSGAADLSSYKPLVVKSVAINNSGTFYPLDMVNQNEAFQNNNVYTAVQVRLVRTATFPTVSSDTVTYGATSSISLIDELIVSTAARFLLRKDREVIAGLEKTQSELLQMLISVESVVIGSSYPTRPLKLPVHWTLVGTTVQLVNKVGESFTSPWFG